MSRIDELTSAIWSSAHRANAFFTSAREAMRRAAAIRVPYSTSRSTGRSSASTATRETGACCPKTARSKSAGRLFRSSRSSVDAPAGSTWADVTIGHSLVDGDLPMPSVEWRTGTIELDDRRLLRAALPATATCTRAIACTTRRRAGSESRWRSRCGRSRSTPAQFLNTAGRREPDPASSPARTTASAVDGKPRFIR